MDVYNDPDDIVNCSEQTTPTSANDDSFIPTVRIPASVILQHVAPFVRDRSTWNALTVLNREIYELSKNNTNDNNNNDNANVDCPWPQRRWRVAAGRRAWCVTFGRQFLACGTDKGSVQLWFCRTGHSKSLSGHTGRVNAICVVGNNQWLITAGDDRSTRVWDISTWKCHAVLTGHKSTICSVAAETTTTTTTTTTTLLTGAKLFATASLDKTIRLYSILDDGGDTATVGCLEVFTGIHRGPVHSVSFCHGYLVSGGTDEQLLLWDVEKLAFSEVLLKDQGEIKSMDVWRDKLALSCGRTIRIYDLPNRTWKDLKGHHSDIRSLAFSPRDGRSLVSSCSDGSIRLWDVENGVCVKKWKAHNDFLVCSVAFCHDGSTILSAGSDGTIALWKT